MRACFRIQREACEAAGRHIPMVVENVKGAQPWVGPANAHFGSFYFWGDVAMVGNQVVAGGLRFGETVKAAKRGRKNDGGSWFNVAHNTESGTANNPVSIPTGRKVDGFNFHQFEKTGEPGGSFQSAAVALKLVDNGALKVPGINWSGHGSAGLQTARLQRDGSAAIPGRAGHEAGSQRSERRQRIRHGVGKRPRLATRPHRKIQFKVRFPQGRKRPNRQDTLYAGLLHRQAV